MARRSVLMAVGVLLMLSSVSCGDDDERESDTTTTSPAPTSAVSMTSTSAAPTTTESTANAATVDLKVTGTLVVNAKGVDGQCETAADAFSVELNEDDFPGLGESFVITKSGTEAGKIAWTFGSNRSWTSSAGATLAFSPDLKTVTIADDLTPVPVATGTPPGPLHISGTITCP